MGRAEHQVGLGEIEQRRCVARQRLCASVLFDLSAAGENPVDRRVAIIPFHVGNVFAVWPDGLGKRAGAPAGMCNHDIGDQALFAGDDGSIRERLAVDHRLLQRVGESVYTLCRLAMRGHLNHPAPIWNSRVRRARDEGHLPAVSGEIRSEIAKLRGIVLMREHNLHIFLPTRRIPRTAPTILGWGRGGNRQRISSRTSILKAESVRRFAFALQGHGIENISDVADDRLAAAAAFVRQKLR